jgi:hypothetical protein
MKYLKAFLESIKSETDSSDYLLELLDDQFLSFKELEFKNIWDSSGNKVIGSNIHYIYSISEDFKIINNNKKLEDYVSKLLCLSKIAKRWNLEFSIFQDELRIIGEAPDYISEFSINNITRFTFSNRYLGYEGFFGKASVSNRFNINLDFFISIRGSRDKIEDYVKTRIKMGKKYKLKLIKDSSGECEFQIVPI